LLHKYDDALLTFREALNIRRHALGHLHPSTASIYNNIGCVHLEFNEEREARRAFEAALDVQRNALCYEPDSRPLLFGTSTTLCNLAYLYTFREMHEKAALLLKEALELQERVLGKTHTTVLSTLDSLADAYGKGGDNNSAMKHFNDIIDRLLDSEKGSIILNPNRSRALAIVYYKISRFHHKQNDLDAALCALKKSWSFVDRVSSTELQNKIKNEINKMDGKLKNVDMDWI